MASVLCKHCGNNNPPEARFCAHCGSSLVATAVSVPAAAPVTAPARPAAVTEYAGFWIRLAAALIDGVIILVVSFFLRIVSFGFLFTLSPFIVWLYYWLFTGLKGQTPGKMAVGIKVVDAGGSLPGLGVAALREILGKIVSSIVFCLGYLWIIWDGEKQGWHDKMAGTYVVPVKPR
jgi:uncharacterized RDD family membrane protein YckC